MDSVAEVAALTHLAPELGLDLLELGDRLNPRLGDGELSRDLANRLLA